ncbi:MAG: GDSL-type esterase/lipase family protein [Candidatus Saccharimonadales bacterium]
MTTQAGTTESVACSGAVIDNIIGNDASNNDFQVRNIDVTQQTIQMAAYALHMPGVLQQQEFVSKDNPQVVTVSIGGNDFGFKDIIRKCAAPFNSFSSASQNCYQTYEDRRELVDTINGQFKNLVGTYGKLKQNDPTRRVYVIGYPQIVKSDGDCGDNVRLSKPDTEFASTLVDYMDSVIARAAASAGVEYVDTQHAFDGHRLCETGEKAVNGLTAGKDANLSALSAWQSVIGNESYHPTKVGHELLADTILAQTHNLTVPMPGAQNVNSPSFTDAEASAILNVPKTNRVIYEVKSAGNDLLSVVAGLNPLTLGLQGLILPSSQVQAVLHSDPINVGTLQADDSGVLTGSLQIPTGTTPGFHTLHLYGKDIFGNPLDVQESVYLEASATDYDGDGIPNISDSCQTIPNSGHDVDQDGIDDACDPIIGAAPPVVLGNVTGTTDLAPNMPGTNFAAGNKTASVLQASSGQQGESNFVQQGSPQALVEPNASVLGARDMSKSTPTSNTSANKSLGIIAVISVVAIGALLVRWRLASTVKH